MNKISLIDVISPVMAGPSSSHTAGAVRLGLIAKNICNGKFNKVKFKLYNSYAMTGIGHGTDKGLLAGILGLNVDDNRIKNIFNTEEAKGISYSFEFLEDFNRHPNAVDIIFEGENNIVISGNSIGGGEIEITRINDFSTKLKGKYDTLFLVYNDKPGVISDVTNIIQKDNVNIASLFCDRSAKGKDASMCICVDGKLSAECLKNIEALDYMFMARYIKKLES